MSSVEKTAGYKSGLDPKEKEGEVVLDEKSQSIYKSAATFESLKLSTPLLNGVYAMKFTAPSLIQARALPIILDQTRKPNIIAQAQAGSGKTAAFVLGMLTCVDEKVNTVQAICLEPTRELAIQVASIIALLGKFTAVKIGMAIPDAPRNKMTQQIVVGTPGTILAKLSHKELDASTVKMFVCDEADQLISKQGLGDQTMMILRKMPRNVQVLLFSATFPDQVESFALAAAKDPVRLSIKREDVSLDAVKQFWINTQSSENRYKFLTTIYGLLNVGQSIIFVNTTACAKELSNTMRKDGFTVSLLHGTHMANTERDKVMEDFRTGRTTVLISTNVLARGIDIQQVTMVVNYDIPVDRQGKADPETYIHRIGRSGRFGRKGAALNLVYDPKSQGLLRDIALAFQCAVIELPGDDLERLQKIVTESLK